MPAPDPRVIPPPLLVRLIEPPLPDGNVNACGLPNPTTLPETPTSPRADNDPITPLRTALGCAVGSTVNALVLLVVIVMEPPLPPTAIASVIAAAEDCAPPSAFREPRLCTVAACKIICP